MARRIDIKGLIVRGDDKWIYDWFGIECTSPNEINDAILEADGEELEVIINSRGGDVFAGSEIYTALMDYKGTVTVKIVGIAASAASIVAMAGGRVLISPTAEIMIHNVESYAAGDYRVMEHEAEVLKDYSSTIANAYLLKTGMKKEELLVLMDEETWLTPEKALKYKFADEIMFVDNGVKLAASIRTTLLPPEVINKMRNMMVKEKEKGPPESEPASNNSKEKARLALECELGLF